MLISYFTPRAGGTEEYLTFDKSVGDLHRLRDCAYTRLDLTLSLKLSHSLPSFLQNALYFISCPLSIVFDRHSPLCPHKRVTPPSRDPAELLLLCIPLR